MKSRLFTEIRGRNRLPHYWTLPASEYPENSSANARCTLTDTVLCALMIGLRFDFSCKPSLLSIPRQQTLIRKITLVAVCHSRRLMRLMASSGPECAARSCVGVEVPRQQSSLRSRRCCSSRFLLFHFFENGSCRIGRPVRRRKK